MFRFYRENFLNLNFAKVFIVSFSNALTYIFKIQSAARYYLREGDLENCTRVLNQLTGEPRRIVADWIHEARLSLEVQQV